MESLIVKSTDILLSQPEEALIDKHQLIVAAVVKGVDSFNKIVKLAFAHRNKNYSESKKEDLGTELTKILFYAGCLSHLCDLEPDSFDLEALTEFSTELPRDLQEDTILCSFNGIRGFMAVADELYLDSEEEDDLPGSDDEIPDEVTVEKITLSPTGSDDRDDDYEGNSIEQLLAEVFAAVIILCERFDLELESVMYNVSTITKL